MNPPDAQAKIRIENTGLSFGSGRSAIEVLRDINLEISDGEFVTLIGPSGSGKSTLLNLISDTMAHLETEVTGSIEIAWRTDDRGRLGYVLQKDTLLPWRTLLGNVEIGLEIQGIAKDQRRKIAGDWIERVGLGGFELAYPHQLSGGMRQRANIIRTLICSPELVLMDEPFGALDAQTRMVLQQMLIDIWNDQRPTICFVTHDLEESILLGDRVVLLGARPGMIRSVYRVEIPHPREVIEVKGSQTFQETYLRIWNDLKDSIPVHLNDPRTNRTR